MQGPILIVSSAKDLHAVAVRRELERAGCPVELLPCDELTNNGLSIELGAERYLQIGTRRLDIDDISKIWWRRTTLRQSLAEEPSDPDHRDYIDKNCRLTLRAFLEQSFTGTWVSSPRATDLAEDKLRQLHLARQLGLRVPNTLVSNDPASVRRFHEMNNSDVIVKSVRSSRRVFLATKRLDLQALTDAQLRMVPNIYQERIPGTRHLRVNVFGERVHAALIESEELDWRPNMNVPVSPYALDASTRRAILALMAEMGLVMGVVDLKIDERDGVPVWLEINPQGQFLFLEPLTGQNLLAEFRDFLLS